MWLGAVCLVLAGWFKVSFGDLIMTFSIVVKVCGFVKENYGR